MTSEFKKKITPSRPLCENEANPGNDEKDGSETESEKDNDATLVPDEEGTVDNKNSDGSSQIPDVLVAKYMGHVEDTQKLFYGDTKF